jgi:glutathione synthase/RimK-type ligase-like ATP-grasp enzyme
MQYFFQSYGLELVRVSINKFNKRQWYFTEYHIFDSTGKNIMVKKPYKPDIIWIRKWGEICHKFETFHNFLLIPSQKIVTLWNDKFDQYQFLHTYQPYTSLLSAFFNNKSIQKLFSGKVVLKPIRSSWWKWIQLTTVNTLLKEKEKYAWLEKLYIVQQFKDFSKWYPWIVKGIHDVRFMFAGKNIIETTCRIPKPWGFKSNVSDWGTVIALKKSQIPKQLLSLSKKIYKDLHIQDDNIFSMDFSYCSSEKKRYLIEINSSPWTWTSRYRDIKILKSIYKGLVSFFHTERLKRQNYYKI